MSVINGRFVGLSQDREFTLHTGRDGEAGGGKIYPVDPAAVAHFKAVLAQQEATKRPSSRRETGIKRASTGLDNDLQQKVNAAAARIAAKKAAATIAEEPDKKNEDEVNPMSSQELTIEQVSAMHGRYMAGENIRDLAAVWVIPGIPNSERPDHPTPKPLQVFEIPMRQHTRAGDVCYEPFSGSGSQIIAGERLGRRVFAMELAPEYVAVALQRYLDATGKRPELAA